MRTNKLPGVRVIASADTVFTSQLSAHVYHCLGLQCGQSFNHDQLVRLQSFVQTDKGYIQVLGTKIQVLGGRKQAVIMLHTGIRRESLVPVL